MIKTWYSLYDRMLKSANFYNAFFKVKENRGAAGVDGVSIKAFEETLATNIEQLVKELKDKSYNPLPVKRVEISKPDGGIRKLGIPAVRDRVVQQVLLDILQPIFDPEFHPSSYGYRPGRGCHQAITKAQLFIRTYNLEWVVDMDLSKCFDTLDHEIIIGSVRKKVTDGSILKLLRKFLNSGILTKDGLKPSEVGSPQGGVISPLLANIYLDAFDKFMMGRGHRIIRYADDILILTGSKRAAENALRVATKYLEKDLKLTVNQKKTHIVHSDDGVKFLGVEIFTEYTRIQDVKVKIFKEKVKKITRRNSPINMEQVIMILNPVVAGFANYFRIANCKRLFKDLAGWIRRRLRAKQMRLWKKGTKLIRKIRQRGYKGKFEIINMNSWRNSKCTYAHMAMPNEFFDTKGLYNMQIIRTGIIVPLP